MIPRLLLAAGLLLAAQAVRADDPVRLRLLSYNIHHGEGVDGKLDLERIARVIREVKPDVVALQEVDRGTERTGKVDQPAELGRLTAMSPIFERNIPYQGGDYGNAVLTRLEIRGHANHKLPSHYRGEQRGVLAVDLLAPDGRTPVRVLATHLDSRGDDAERMASCELIARLAAETLDRPLVLMGDLNARPDSRVLALFELAWTRANTEPLPTFPAAEPNRQIDYVLVRPAARWRVVEVRVLDEAVASDHRPILAVLELVDGED